MVAYTYARVVDPINLFFASPFKSSETKAETSFAAYTYAIDVEPINLFREPIKISTKQFRVLIGNLTPIYLKTLNSV